MSGSNDPNQGREPNQGGQYNQGRQPPQGGRQQQGGQQRQTRQGQQRSQVPRGQQRRQQPSAGGGGGGALDSLKAPEPSSYLKGIIGAMATAGILLGVLAFVIGSIGGFAVLPGAVSDLEDMAQDGGSTGDGLQATPDVSQEEIDRAKSNTHKTLTGYLTSLITPFIAFLMAPLFGAIVAFQMSGTSSTKQLTVAAGTFVGTILFVVLATFIASIVIPDATAFVSGQEASSIEAVAQMLGVSTALGSVQFVTLLINSALAGAVAAAAGAASVFSIDNFVRA